MQNHDRRPERRHHVRASPKGTATVRASTYVIRGRIANLSLEGLSVRTRVTAPERLLGVSASVDLRLDGPNATWQQLQAKVIRISAGSLALALDQPPASFVRTVEEILAASNHHHRLLSVLLVDATPARRQVVAEAFRAAGCSVVDTATPLEAIVRLGESNFEPDLIAIADSLPQAISDELRRFVDDEHPRAKLVTIGDGASAPEGLLHWLSAADPGGDLAARIRKVLTTFPHR